MKCTVASIAELVQGTVIGNDQLELTGISSLTEARPGDISFLANPAYAAFLSQTKASAVLVTEPQDTDIIQIVVPNPDMSFALVVSTHGPQARPLRPGIDPTAHIGDETIIDESATIGPYAVITDGAHIGADTVIHAHAFIGSDVRIGDDCTIYPHVTVRERCELGHRVVVHSGVVIGSDGFGYASLEGVHHKIPQVGIVVIGDDVEIGANTTIDRARFGVTRIGTGTKIDNLVQIAHNAELGEHCIIVAQVGIAGSTTLGRHVTMAGQSGIAGHLSVGDEAVIAARCGVAKNIPSKATVMGFPAQDIRVHKKQEVAMRRLPRTNDLIKQLEQRVAQLEELLAKQLNNSGTQDG